MNAAVVRSFGDLPAYESIDTPTPTGPDQMLIDVLAAGLHPRTRSSANGSHYSSKGVLPMIPGFDGIGRDRDGQLRYFILDDTHFGSMAEQVLIDPRGSTPLPADTDVLNVAAAMNPGMSSGIALRNRYRVQAAGRACSCSARPATPGQMAVQIAKHLGAGHVIARRPQPRTARRSDRPGRRPHALTRRAIPTRSAEALGTAAAAVVHVVIDYLWGPTTETDDARRHQAPHRQEPSTHLDRDRLDVRPPDQRPHPRGYALPVSSSSAAARDP